MTQYVRHCIYSHKELECNVPVTGEAETGARPQLAEHREGIEAYTGGVDKQATDVTQRPVLPARRRGGAGHVWRVGDRDLGRPLYLQQQPGAAASIENKRLMYSLFVYQTIIFLILEVII